MILVTGPTGSGKTTTLYSLIDILRKPEDKIITLEDPIEYQIPGILQSEINERDGYTFALGLRSILRHDPDIIMVGEIRDLDTATAAVQAALTGHLVLSTLHTKSALETIERLMNIGVSDFDIASSVDCVIAQRLVRRVCPDCAAPADIGFTPDTKLLARYSDQQPHPQK
jgi:type II secretory ATPase GspE/PulE/Tfp pilus assembly ATPase PilB-like protein